LNRFNNLSTIKKNRHHSVPHKNKDERFVPEINKKSKIIDRKRNAMSRTPRHDLLLKVGQIYNKNKSRISLEHLSKEANQ